MSDEIDMAARYVVDPEASATRMGDETVLVSIRTGSYFGLDDVGTYLWALIEKGVSPQDACDALCRDYDVSVETAQRDVQRLFSELEANGLIVPGA